MVCFYNAGRRGSHPRGRTSHISTCGNPAGTQTGSWTAPVTPSRAGAHTQGATAHPTPRAPGGTVFCKLTALTKLHKRRPPGSRSPRPTCWGLGLARATEAPCDPGGERPSWPLPAPAEGRRFGSAARKLPTGCRSRPGTLELGGARGLGARVGAGLGRGRGPTSTCRAGRRAEGVEAGGLLTAADNGPRARPDRAALTAAAGRETAAAAAGAPSRISSACTATTTTGGGQAGRRAGARAAATARTRPRRAGPRRLRRRRGRTGGGRARGLERGRRRGQCTAAAAPQPPLLIHKKLTHVEP